VVCSAVLPWPVPSSRAIEIEDEMNQLLLETGERTKGCVSNWVERKGLLHNGLCCCR
jgi:hypothetical protein